MKNTPLAEQTLPSEHSQAMERLYRWQAPVFDLLRWPVLLGRHRLASHIRPAHRLLEVGCGTGHNLPALRRAVGHEGSVIGIECAAAMARRARRHAGPGIEIRELEFGTQSAGPVDAAVFSYSLSMIPDYLTALDRIFDDLAPGGQILVLDFVDSPLPPLRGMMHRMGVHLGESRWAALRSRFEVSFEHEHRAFGGLWRYRLMVGERPPDPGPQSR